MKADRLPTGFLLDGRVRHAQAADGHRTGIEPVLLAASVPARAGDLVLEGGSGSGAGLLCLAARVSGVRGVGVERDASQAALATANIVANDLGDTLRVDVADLLEWRAAGPFDHAIANPPWHDGAGTASPDPAREAARRSHPGLFGAWLTALARPLRHRGTLTLVVGVAALPACLAGLDAAGCGSPAVLPLWPAAGQPAKLLLFRAVRGGRAPFTLRPGLPLHDELGRFTAAAEAVLRNAAPLPL